jgi:RND family efflux transporter MFP subunit
MNAFHASAFATVAVCSLTLAGCAKHGGDEDAEQETPRPLVAVRGVEITSGDAVQTLTVTGRTDVLRRQRVISPVAGTISSLAVLEGASVTPRQVLATILTKESQSAIAGAEALVRMARTPGQKAEAERALELARSTENSVVVTAPWGGNVASRSVNQGELVAENAELCTLVDLASVVFMAEVPLHDIAQIHAGMAARVHLTSLDGSDLPARVEALLPKADAQSQTALVRLRLNAGASTGRLRPDMGGTAGIITGIHKNALLVPRSAVLRDDEKKSTSVVIVTPDSLALSVPVDAGAATDSIVEVRSDVLKKGMMVITEGNYAIADSTRVIVNSRDQR